MQSATGVGIDNPIAIRDVNSKCGRTGGCREHVSLCNQQNIEIKSNKNIQYKVLKVVLDNPPQKNVFFPFNTSAKTSQAHFLRSDFEKRI